MKLFLLMLISMAGGVVSGEHYHSFFLGLSIASLAVGSCYWFAFRSTRYPQLALFLLICGMMSKLVVTVAGIAVSYQAELITSPLTFALSYLFFTGVVTYGYFKFKDVKQNRLMAEQGLLKAA